MPGVTGYNNVKIFARANGRSGVTRLNRTPNTADQGTMDQLGNRGICSGITSAWVIGCLSGLQEGARSLTGFRGYFINVLRFQGAYFKELHGTSEEHLGELGTHMNHHVVFINRVNRKKLANKHLPHRGWWAAYVSLRGHAIGIGKHNATFYIMDPNFGLNTYQAQPSFLLDLNQVRDAYKAHAGHHKRMKIYFYRRG